MTGVNQPEGVNPGKVTCKVKVLMKGNVVCLHLQVVEEK